MSGGIGEIITTKSLTIQQAKFEGAVAQCIRDWAIAFPHEVVALDRMTHEMRRDDSYHGNKKSNMAHFAEVPVKLHRMMQRRFDIDWINRQDIARIFFRHFRVGLLNLKSMPDFEK